MTPTTGSLLRGLDPSPAQARDWLARELHGSRYRDPWLDSAIRWIGDQLRRFLDGAGHLAGLSPVITVLLALAVIALLAWVLPKVRREQAAAASSGAVLEDVSITPAFYRGLAARAMREGRYDGAVLDGFRAIAKDMSDRSLLDDAPGRTAHEVSLALASPFPEHADRLVVAADLFDAVRYGHRQATAEAAGAVQRLDAELVTTRPSRLPLPHPSLFQDLPV